MLLDILTHDKHALDDRHAPDRAQDGRGDTRRERERETHTEREKDKRTQLNEHE